MRGRLALLLAGAALVAVVVVGLLQSSSASESPNGPTPPSLVKARAQLAGAPAPLAALHAQANALLPGSAGAMRKQLAALEGHPVVVNKWASWCGPCRAEWDTFQRVSVSMGKQVAFVGVDFQDTPGNAKAYLAKRPVSYPSLVDDDGEEAARVVEAGRVGPPQTIFYDASGKLRYIHSGPYLEDADLEADIQKYALG